MARSLDYGVVDIMADPAALRRRPRTLALGFWLASRGPSAKLMLAFSVALAIAGVFASRWMAHDDTHLLPLVPRFASYAFAWGAALGFGVAAAARAPFRDVETGVLALIRARGGTLSEYVIGRVGGLALWLGLLSVGGTAITSVAALSVAHPTGAMVRASAGAALYALVFALAMGPLAMATLGGRSRFRGYLAFLAVIVLPELGSPWVRTLIPEGWHELTSLPSALETLQSVASASTNGLAASRALAGLTAVAAISIVIVHAHAVRAAQRTPS